jgi:Cell division protein FtsI/penicillin-binding protein 2
LFVIVIHRLFFLQIIEGPTIQEKNEVKSALQREIDSPRGNIYDREGKLLASNSLSYSVVMTDNTSIKTNEQKNAIIHQMIQLIEANGDTLDNEFFIKKNEEGKLEFTVTDTDALKRIKKNVYTYVLKKNKLTKEQENASAKEVYEFLRSGKGYKNQGKMFDIDKSYSVNDTLKIMNVRYMLLCNYPKYLSITIASNVNPKTIAAIEENSADMIGVEVRQKANRVYTDGTYFSNILGYTGTVSASELDTFKKEKKDYNLSDQVGKAGIEKTFEDVLRGTKGSETVSVNSYDKVESIKQKKDPIAGNDVYLTIQADLQKAAYDLLERKLADILLEFITPDMNYGTKGESDKEILIPIFDVYNALIKNNIIDTNQFSASDASDLEKDAFNKFKSKRSEVINKLNSYLKLDNTTPNKDAGDMEDYLDYLYSVMIDKDILIAKEIPADDQTLQDYKNDKISLSKFLQYALAENWVDLDKLNVGDKYYSTEELYQKLINYSEEKILKNDSIFNKKVYRDLVYSHKLSGTEICLLLFDQGVLKSNKDDVAKLESGRISPYSFIRNKIDSLEITPGMLALEPCSGSVIVTDPRNGDVLALVTYPGYDNNKYSGKIDTAYYNKIYNDLSYPSMNRPLMSRIIPGSTFKMITATAALEDSKVNTSEYIFDEFEFKKSSPHAFCMHHHGTVNVIDAIKVSCNYFFYEMGWRLNGNSGAATKQLGLDKLKKYATLLGLNEKTGIELGELDPQMSTVDAVRSSIGQGTNYFAPAQIAKYATTLANRGTCYNLTVLDKIVNNQGKLIKDNKAKISHKAKEISPSTWNAVMQGMYDVANESGGTAYNYFHDFGVKVAGKTGTAQINDYHASNALFVSFAPYEDPKVSVTVAIPNGYSSTYAAAVAKNVYSYYFGYKDLKTLMQEDEKKIASRTRVD